MKALLKKELRIALHPTSVIFLHFGAMVLIPNYPYYTVFFYFCLGVFFTCLTGRENQDIQYTMLLPVRKGDIVRARIAVTAVMQLLSAACTMPFIFIRRGMPVGPNQAGIEANLAMAGIGFVLMGLFNLTFFGVYCKNPRRVGIAFLSGAGVMLAGSIASEVLIHFPKMAGLLDNYKRECLPCRALTLGIGFGIYTVLTGSSAVIGRRRFEKYDIE